jgi:hypothetical protein
MGLGKVMSLETHLIHLSKKNGQITPDAFHVLTGMGATHHLEMTFFL